MIVSFLFFYFYIFIYILIYFFITSAEISPNINDENVPNGNVKSECLAAFHHTKNLLDSSSTTIKVSKHVNSSIDTPVIAKESIKVKEITQTESIQSKEIKTIILSIFIS